MMTSNKITFRIVFLNKWMIDLMAWAVTMATKLGIRYDFKEMGVNTDVKIKSINIFGIIYMFTWVSITFK